MKHKNKGKNKNSNNSRRFKKQKPQKGQKGATSSKAKQQKRKPVQPKRERKELSREKKQALIERYADEAAHQTSKKLLSLLEASHEIKQSEALEAEDIAKKQRIAEKQKRKLERAEAVKRKALELARATNEVSDTADTTDMSDLLESDISSALAALRAESKETHGFMTVDAFQPFSASEIADAEDSTEKTIPTKIAPAHITAPVKTTPPISATSIIEQWKATQKPLAVTTEHTDGPEHTSLAQQCRLPADAIIKPEDFDDLLDPVGFGETNYRPPEFKAIPQKTAKMLPFHRMSAKTIQRLRPDG